MAPAQTSYERIPLRLPKPRENVHLPNRQVLNAILHGAGHGGQWRGLPEHFGHWHTLDTRMSRGSKNGILDRVFEHLQREQIVRIKVEAFGLDSPRIQGHPDGTGARRKNDPRSIGQSRGGGNTSLHRVAAEARTAVAFTRSCGPAHDAPPGRRLLNRRQAPSGCPARGMDRADEDHETRQQGLDRGFTPGVLPRKNRVAAWKHGRRLFRRLRGFRRGFSRFDKRDVMFLGFIVFGLIIEALR